MPSSRNWDQQAGLLRERELEGIRQTGKISVFLSVLVLIVASIVFGVVQLVRWGFNGESLLPAKTDIYWFVGMVFWLVILPPVIERWDVARRLRAQRLIRIELKIEALLDRQDDVDSQLGCEVVFGAENAVAYKSCTTARPPRVMLCGAAQRTLDMLQFFGFKLTSAFGEKPKPTPLQ